MTPTVPFGYGRGGMMNGYAPNQTITPTIPFGGMIGGYVKANLPNASVEKEGDTFYGYYNFDVLQNGNTYGMLSVNGYTGAVWYHTWHGNLIAKETVN